MTGLPGAAGMLVEDGAGIRLLGGACRGCGHPHFPAAETCPYCGSADVATTTLSTRGTLWSWTAVTAAPPGYRGAVPYGFGVVELPEGLRLITRLTVADPASLSLGQPMELVAEVLPHDDDSGGHGPSEVVTWTFAPVAESAVAASPADGTPGR